MKSAGVVLGSSVALSAIADVLASFVSWRGAPTDTSWKPSFWKYEVWRLSEWLPFAVLAAALVFAVAYTFSHYALYLRRHFPSAAIMAAVGFSVAALGIEYTTSVRFWQRVPHDEAVMLWISERAYVREHLVSWLVSAALILLVTFWLHKRRLRRNAA